MAIPSSGTLTFADLQAEFGGSHPISISEYYRDGALVPGNNTNVPTSGAVALSNYYGAVNEIGVTASGGAALDLSTLFSGANYSGTVPKRVTVNAGTTIGSMTIPTFGGTLTIDNAGEIQGARGSGNGAAGGHAIVLSGGTLVVNNTGAIRGAGGNGNTGSAGGAGGNGSYSTACTTWGPCNCPCSNTGSGPLCGGSCSQNIGCTWCGGSCSGGEEEYYRLGWTCYNTTNTSGGAGGAGGGTSGLGQGYGVSNTNGNAGSGGAAGGTNAGTGGTGSAASNGGTWGVAGGNSATGATGANGNASSGSGGTAGKSGGAAGKAISVVGGSRTLNNTGTINGATS